MARLFPSPVQAATQYQDMSEVCPRAVSVPGFSNNVRWHRPTASPLPTFVVTLKPSVSLKRKTPDHWICMRPTGTSWPPNGPAALAEALQQSNRSKARSEMARVLFGRSMLRFLRRAPILLRSCASLKAHLRARTLPTTMMICGEHQFCRYRHQDQAFPTLLPVFYFPRPAPFPAATVSEPTPSRQDTLRARLFFRSEERQPSRVCVAWHLRAAE